jgi:hypothetical protein
MKTGETVIYQKTGGKIIIDVRLEEETVWLIREHMAFFFEKPGIPLPNTFKMFLKKAGWTKK